MEGFGFFNFWRNLTLFRNIHVFFLTLDIVDLFVSLDIKIIIIALEVTQSKIYITQSHHTPKIMQQHPPNPNARTVIKIFCLYTPKLTTRSVNFLYCVPKISSLTLHVYKMHLFKMGASARR